MAKAYVFPGQSAQFVGMGKDLYESNTLGVIVTIRFPKGDKVIVQHSLESLLQISKD